MAVEDEGGRKASAASSSTLARVIITQLTSVKREIESARILLSFWILLLFAFSADCCYFMVVEGRSAEDFEAVSLIRG